MCWCFMVKCHFTEVLLVSLITKIKWVCIYNSAWNSLKLTWIVRHLKKDRGYNNQNTDNNNTYGLSFYKGSRIGSASHKLACALKFFTLTISFLYIKKNLAILKRDKCMINLYIKSLIFKTNVPKQMLKFTQNNMLNEVKNKSTSLPHQINMPVNY